MPIQVHDNGIRNVYIVYSWLSLKDLLHPVLQFFFDKNKSANFYGIKTEEHLFHMQYNLIWTFRTNCFTTLRALND